MAMRKTLSDFIPQVREQIKPLLNAFLESLGIRRTEEEKRRLQKLEPMGRVTTGFVPEMYREVGEQVGREETGYRATHEANILEQAMGLLGLEEEWYRMQEQMTWQTRQNELDRALQRELAKMKTGGGGGGIPIDFSGLLGGGGGETIDGFRLPTATEVALAETRAKVTGATAYQREQERKKIEQMTRQVPIYATTKAPTTTYARTKAYQPSQKVTSYRGTRLGRI